MHFRKKDCEFFSKNFKKLQIFYYIINGDFQKFFALE